MEPPFRWWFGGITGFLIRGGFSLWVLVSIVGGDVMDAVSVLELLGGCPLWYESGASSR